MSWIKEISYEEAEGRLKKIYDRVKGPNNNIDNVLSVHSLRPHTLLGHMTLYKNVLHNSNNTLPKWYLEVLGTYVSAINQCDYCVAHHSTGMRRLIADEPRSEAILESIRKDHFDNVLTSKEIAGLDYAKKLTLDLHNIQEADVSALRTAGLNDGEILEINQVISYFNYVNRTVLGLGVNTLGDIIGLSPNDSDNPDDWSHQ